LKSYDFSELKEAVLINSFTKNRGGVNSYGNFFRERMEKIGFQTNTCVREEIGNHLLFRSDMSGGKRLLLLGHLDTVFPEGSFEGFREDEEWIYGAGVCDMKGGNEVAYLSLKQIYEKFGKVENIDLLLVSDEETGSDDSKKLTQKIGKSYDYSFVFEAGGVNDEVVVGRKGVGTFFIDIKGVAAHAGNSYSSGADANLEASFKTIELVKLTDLDSGTTVNVGKIEGGIGANTISPHSKLTFEIRYRNSQERERVLSEINRIVSTSFVDGTESTLSGGIQRDVMEATEEKFEFIKKLEKITGKTIPTESRGGVSDANTVSSVGVLTVDGFGPFGDGDHTVNERASKKSFFERVDMMEKILTHFMEFKGF
jgi:glutamate carboxypeptidase